MFDLRWIRDHPEAFDAGLARRGLAPASPAVLDLDRKRRGAQTELQDLQTRRGAISKRIGEARREGRESGALAAEATELRARIQALEETRRQAEADIDAALAGLPNLPDCGVPDGADETANVELRRVGDPPAFDFPARDHAALGEALGQMDFAAASRLSGARFVVLTGALARLERALGNFMIDLHRREFGYLEVSPPALLREPALFGTGQLPKFAGDLFRTDDGRWLSPTAEVPLTNLAAGEILDASALPLRFAALTPCFRSEAGAAGRDTRGMLRQHQFAKVELVSVAAPEDSEAEHDRMTRAAETVLQRLGLPYRVMALSAGDMGFAARKTYDIEVWLPGQSRYREISSCSNCGDFQARRMRARYRPAGGRGTAFPHTLNGSGVAVGRALVAVMENFQREDGAVRVPEALRPYLDGLDAVEPAA